MVVWIERKTRAAAVYLTCNELNINVRTHNFFLCPFQTHTPFHPHILYSLTLIGRMRRGCGGLVRTHNFLRPSGSPCLLVLSGSLSSLSVLPCFWAYSTYPDPNLLRSSASSIWPLWFEACKSIFLFHHSHSSATKESLNCSSPLFVPAFKYIL